MFPSTNQPTKLTISDSSVPYTSIIVKLHHGSNKSKSSDSESDPGKLFNNFKLEIITCYDPGLGVN